MIDIIELKQDFKSQMTIGEVLIKHGLTFKEAVALCSIKQPRKPKKSSRHYEPTGEEYIRKYGRKYVIRRNIKGKQKWFGSYKTLEDAIKVRDCLNEEGWSTYKVQPIREKLGV